MSWADEVSSEILQQNCHVLENWVFYGCIFSHNKHLLSILFLWIKNGNRWHHPFFFFSFPDKILFLEKFKGKIWKAYIMLASLLKGAVLLLALVSRRFHSGNDEAICVLPEISLPQVLQQLCPCWSRSCSDTLPVPCKLWDDSMYSWGSFCAMCDKYVACKVILLGVFFFNIGWICYCGMCNPLVEKKKNHLYCIISNKWLQGPMKKQQNMPGFGARRVSGTGTVPWEKTTWLRKPTFPCFS